MRWMMDFDAAEKVGMGIRARLAREDAAAGLDFVLVMGIGTRRTARPTGRRGWRNCSTRTITPTA